MKTHSPENRRGLQASVAALCLMVTTALAPTMLVRGPVFFGFGGGGGVGGIAADLWQDFELDTLTGGNLAGTDHIADGTWSIVDTETKFSTSTSGQKAFTSQINSTTDTGTRGLAKAIDSTTAASIQYTWAAALGATPCSYSLWIKTPTTLTAEVVFEIFQVYSGDGWLCSAGFYDLVAH